MKYLHTMIRVLDLEKSLEFFTKHLGLKEIRRHDSEQGRFSLIFLASGPDEPPIELTYNWDRREPYSGGRNFGHLAYSVENIYEKCEQLQRDGIEILRPPRDGRMAFIKSPDGISIELLQAGEALAPREPWVSMPSKGEW